MYGKATVLYQIGEFNKALSLIRSVEELMAPNIGTLNDRAAILHALGRYEEALKAIDKAIAMREDSSVVWRNKGTILTSSGRRDEAEVSFRRALVLDPTNKDALSGISALLANEEGVAYETIGLVLVRRGSDEALPYLEKAIALGSRVASVHSAKDMALIHAGRLKEAVDSFDEALRIDPNCKQASVSKNLFKLLLRPE